MGKKEDLGFWWEVKFADGKSLSQFDKDGNEVPYSDIENYPSDLVEFSATDGNKYYIVDLSKQEMSTPKTKYTINGANPELIYFRRNNVRMEIGPKENRVILPPLVVHYLGLKTDTDEKVFELFNGCGMKEKVLKFKDEKTKEEIDIKND